MYIPAPSSRGALHGSGPQGVLLHQCLRVFFGRQPFEGEGYHPTYPKVKELCLGLGHVGEKNPVYIYIWVFPKIMVPPNHPF